MWTTCLRQKGKAMRKIGSFACPKLLAVRPETVEHAMQCTARLIRALLGASSIADKKLAFGCSGPEILGVDMKLLQIGFQCRPSQQKVVAWCNQIQEALTAGFLAPGAASKLAGRLSWGAGALFRRLGRAMLRPENAERWQDLSRAGCSTAMVAAGSQIRAGRAQGMESPSSAAIALVL